MKHVKAISILKVLLLLCFFSALMALGACPPWFLALLITISLLQVAAWLFFKIQQPPGAPPLIAAPTGIARWNTAAQLGWIGLLFLQISLQTGLRLEWRFSGTFQATGYLMLASLQIFVFYRLFCQYRPLLLTDLRHLTATP